MHRVKPDATTVPFRSMSTWRSKLVPWSSLFFSPIKTVVTGMSIARQVAAPTFPAASVPRTQTLCVPVVVKAGIETDTFTVVPPNVPLMELKLPPSMLY